MAEISMPFGGQPFINPEGGLQGVRKSAVKAIIDAPLEGMMTALPGKCHLDTRGRTLVIVAIERSGEVFQMLLSDRDGELAVQVDPNRLVQDAASNALKYFGEVRRRPRAWDIREAEHRVGTKEKAAAFPPSVETGPLKHLGERANID